MHIIKFGQVEGGLSKICSANSVISSLPQDESLHLCLSICDRLYLPPFEQFYWYLSLYFYFLEKNSGAVMGDRKVRRHTSYTACREENINLSFYLNGLCSLSMPTLSCWWSLLMLLPFANQNVSFGVHPIGHQALLCCSNPLISLNKGTKTHLLSFKKVIDLFMKTFLLWKMG